MVDALDLKARDTDAGATLWHLKSSTEPFTGVAVAKFPDGRTQARATFLRGQKHGLETRGHSNGQIEREQHWQQGKLHGSHTHWDEAGNKLWCTECDHGLPARARSWHPGGQPQGDIIYRDGAVISRIEWDANGTRRVLPGFTADGTPRR